MALGSRPKKEAKRTLRWKEIGLKGTYRQKCGAYPGHRSPHLVHRRRGSSGGDGVVIVTDCCCRSSPPTDFCVSEANKQKKFIYDSMAARHFVFNSHGPFQIINKTLGFLRGLIQSISNSHTNFLIPKKANLVLLKVKKESDLIDSFKQCRSQKRGKCIFELKMGGKVGKLSSLIIQKKDSRTRMVGKKTPRVITCY